MSFFSPYIERIRRGWHPAVLHDLFMAAVSFPLAVALRFGDTIGAYPAVYLLLGALFCTLIAACVFAIFRLDRGLWRYASVRDLATMAKATLFTVLLFTCVLFVLTRLEGLPRSVPFIQAGLLLLLLGGPRFLYRMAANRHTKLDWSAQEDTSLDAVPVVLFGAGDAAELFVREAQRKPGFRYRPVAILSADPAHAGRQIHGVRIYGGIEAMEAVQRKLTRQGNPPEKLILTETGLEGETVRALVAEAARVGLTVARLPDLEHLRGGLAGRFEVRAIAVEDLLGRPQTRLNRPAMEEMIRGRRVAVTGAGGTIGGELTRQLASFGPSELLLLEQSEFALYRIDREIAELFPALPRAALLCDVRDQHHVNAVFQEYKPELVFHAAAIKHVPIAEHNVEETVLTNVHGTKNVADACAAAHVRAMVLISTDKAVNPANVMGAAKRLAESYCQAMGADTQARGDTRFITVRFGNVLGSTGSVVPLFQEQLARGGPLTVTHPDMVRYFMTVKEAVELVLQAATLGVASAEGAIFVLDMGKPVRIRDLAEQMIRLAGLTPERDVAIAYTGLRPGEKLFEELFYAGEQLEKTAHESILRAQPRAVPLTTLAPRLKDLYDAAMRRRTGQALDLLRLLVPEFTSATPVSTHQNADIVLP